MLKRRHRPKVSQPNYQHVVAGFPDEGRLPSKTWRTSDFLGGQTITTDFCVEKSSRFARTPRLDGRLVKNGEKNSSIF